MFIGTSQMPFPAQPQANFPAFPAMGGPMPPTTMMGAVMGQGGAMMGQNTGMMVGMTMPNGFMGNAPAGVMGVAPGMMGAQAGAMPGQQTQWSMGQVKGSTCFISNKPMHKDIESADGIMWKHSQGIHCAKHSTFVSPHWSYSL